MPAKRGGVITTGEARLLMKDASTMKTALLCLQIEAGDRLDDARLRNPNQSDSARGFAGSQTASGRTRDIVTKLAAARPRVAPTRRSSGTGEKAPGSCADRARSASPSVATMAYWVAVAGEAVVADNAHRPTAAARSAVATCTASRVLPDSYGPGEGRRSTTRAAGRPSHRPAPGTRLIDALRPDGRVWAELRKQHSS